MASTPSLEAVQALDGRNFAMLTTEEQAVLAFYRGHGRKYDVPVTILSDADSKALERASRAQADEIMKRANSYVRIVIGPGAEAARAARPTNLMEKDGLHDAIDSARNLEAPGL